MRRVVGCVLLLVLGSCGSGEQPAGSVAVTVEPVTTSPVTTSPVTTSPVTTSPVTTSPIGAGDCPEVVAAELNQTAPGVFTVHVTVRSVDIEGVSYADAWVVRTAGGEVLGERVLTHPHADEQPFTRSLSGVAIPTGVTDVEVEARDSVRGFCGVSFEVGVPHT